MMKTLSRGFILIAICLGLGPASAAAQEGAKQSKRAVTNKKCPVMLGQDVKEDIRTEYKGQYVYFCCRDCMETFSKDPEMYIGRLSKEDQEAIKVNTLCPITNEPVDKAISIESKGRKIYFCCPDCPKKFREKEKAK